jgi:hypothetical protein
MEDKLTSEQKKAIKDRDYAQEQFDKLIIYIASGALVLSIAFVNEIIKVIDPKTLFSLKLSWVLFVTALLLNLSSHRSAIVAMNQFLKSYNNSSNLWDKITRALDFSSFIALFGGIVLFLFFVLKSL